MTNKEVLAAVADGLTEALALVAEYATDEAVDVFVQRLNKHLAASGLYLELDNGGLVARGEW